MFQFLQPDSTNTGGFAVATPIYASVFPEYLAYLKGWCQLHIYPCVASNWLCIAF